MNNRRSFFSRLGTTAAIVALAPSIAFSRKLNVEAEGELLPLSVCSCVARQLSAGDLDQLPLPSSAFLMWKGKPNAR